ncbi:MAG: type II toxin-antitoxin system CcdA family antitoxin [Sulfurimonas sp.]|jgi:antitoxin CcdA
MTAIYNPRAAKKATNLSVNSDLLQQAKELKINLSQSLEEYLTQKIIEKKSQEWLLQNQDAINDYNERVSGRGVFSDGLRRF